MGDKRWYTNKAAEEGTEIIWKKLKKLVKKVVTREKRSGIIGRSRA